MDWFVLNNDWYCFFKKMAIRDSVGNLRIFKNYIKDYIKDSIKDLLK